MTIFINFLRIVAGLFMLVGVFYKMQDSPDADNMIKGALFILMVSAGLWIIARLRRGKGAY